MEQMSFLSPRDSPPVGLNPAPGEAERKYFQWLCELAKANQGPMKKAYYILCRMLHDKEFYAVLEQDTGRAMDGEALRKLWAKDETELAEIDKRPCSMLEMLLGLAERINYYMENVDDNLELWPNFYILLDNLGLLPYNDQAIVTQMGSEYYSEIHDILNTALERTYAPDGTGGFFPIPGTERDQRDVEIWYQMNEWLLRR